MAEVLLVGRAMHEQAAELPETHQITERDLDEVLRSLEVDLFGSSKPRGREVAAEARPTGER